MTDENDDFHYGCGGPCDTSPSESLTHRMIRHESAPGTSLTCSCGGLGCFFVGGEWKRSEIDAKFREHLSEQGANTIPSDDCYLDLRNIGGSRFPTGQPHNWVWTKSPHSVFIGVCSICHTVNFENLRATVADVWDEAYKHGVHDERTAPVDRRYGPNRNNPYRPDQGVTDR